MTSWLRFFWTPLLIGVLLVSVGVVFFAGGGADSVFVASLLALVGGWAAAFAVVNGVSVLPERVSWVVHCGLAAAALGALSCFGVVLDALEELPPYWEFAGLAALALPTACGWVLITLVSRFSNRVRCQAAQRALSIPLLDWSDGDDQPRLRVVVARVSFRRLILLIVTVTVLGGALAGTAVFALEPWVSSMGPTLFIVLIGAVIMLPSYLLVRWLVNRHRLALTVRWGSGEVVMDAGAAWKVPFTSLTRFVWQQTGNVARIEVHTAERCETYLVGMVRQHGGIRPQLPALREQMVKELERAGLRSARSRQGALLFEQAAGPACAEGHRTRRRGSPNRIVLPR